MAGDETLLWLVEAWVALLGVLTLRSAWLLTFGAALRAGAEKRAAGQVGTQLAPFTLVRVCGGAEPHLSDNLVSVACVGPDAPHDVLLVVPADDPQVSLVQAAAAALVARGIPTAVLLTTAVGANHKVAQLDASFARWPRERAVVCADGDVDLTGYPLSKLVAPLAQPQIAAVWAPCIETPAVVPGFGGRFFGRASAAVSSTSLHCFALLGRLDPRGMVGKLWAVRRADIVRAGGWESLVDILGEDMELARRFRAAGMRVVMADACARARPVARGFSAAVQRYARWFWVIRTQRPHLLVSYPVLFFGTLNVLAVSGFSALWLASHAPQRLPALTMVAAAAVVLRVILGACVRRACGPGVAHLLRDCVLGEATIAAAFVCMLLQRHVRWRHQRLRVHRGGRVIPAPEAP